jgi:uncharacterized lipoprotein YmbA
MIAIFSRRLALFLITLMALCGCLGRSQPTRFYLLQPISSIPAGKTDVEKAQGMRIGVGPLSIPEYVDRPQIVTLVGPHELDLADFDQWSEPLQESVPRTLGENLSTLLSTQHIYLYPWKGSMPIDYQIEVDIIRFDATRGGDAVLNARWTILAGDSKEILVRKHSAVTQEAGGLGYEDLVAAESRLLETLSREMAAAIKSIAQSK